MMDCTFTHLILQKTGNYSYTWMFLMHSPLEGTLPQAHKHIQEQNVTLEKMQGFKLFQMFPFLLFRLALSVCSTFQQRWLHSPSQTHLPPKVNKEDLREPVPVIKSCVWIHWSLPETLDKRVLLVVCLAAPRTRLRPLSWRSSQPPRRAWCSGRGW